jgi:hypothetical protein
MNWAALPSWLITALLVMLLGVLPAASGLLDGPSETDAAQATAKDKADAVDTARRAAHETRAQRVAHNGQ